MDRHFDLLLRGGRVIDPASGHDGIADVAITGSHIAAIGAGLPIEAAAEVVDVSGKFVLPGMIDTHAHVYQYVTGRFELRDNSGERVEASEMIVPRFALRAGKRFDVDSPLVPAPARLAA
jgi:predicted amidohydrolase YtcJ